MPVSQVLRAATWNIQHGRRWDTGSVDPEALAKACVDLDVDLLALQEVDRRTSRVRGVDLLAVVADATGLAAIDGHVVGLDTGTYGNALLVQPDLLDEPVGVQRLHRPWLPPWQRPEPRGAVVARLRHGVTVVAAHLGLRRRERKRQLDGLFDVAGDGPAVVLGDLNAFHLEVDPHARRHGFLPLDVPPAFPASAPRCVIDHALVRGIEARPCPDAGRPAVSDHRPVVIEVERGYFSSASSRL